MNKTGSKIAACLLLFISLTMVIYFYVGKVRIEDEYSKLESDYSKIVKAIGEKSVEKDSTVVNGETTYENGHIVVDNQILISLDVLENHIDDQYRVSNSGMRLYFDYENLSVSFDDDRVMDYINENLESINIPLYISNENKYVELRVIEKLFPIYYQINQEENILYIGTRDKMNCKVEVDKDTKRYIRIDEEYFFCEYEEEDIEGIVLENIDGYKKIYLEDGSIGYYEIIGLEKTSEDLIKAPIFEISEKSTIDIPISLSWDMIESYSANFQKTYFDFNNGINIISPTWFGLNIEGIILNEASFSYIDKIKNEDENIQIWGMYDNSFDIDWTNSMLTNKEYSNSSIAQLLMYSAIYELDGINIDFENVYLENQDDLTSYVNDVKTQTENMNLFLSIDATRPGGSQTWSQFMDREEISKVVDYVFLMAYDEHWASSPESGSVASYDWTEESITKSLDYIANEKLVLGIPLYMRVWVEDLYGNVRYSEALTVSSFEQYIANENYTESYDEEAQQVLIEYSDGESIYKIWVEDSDSLEWRLDFAKKYDLAGVATWSKSFGSDYVWNQIEEYIN